MKTNVKTTILKGLAMITSFIIIFLCSYVYGQSMGVNLSVNDVYDTYRFENAYSDDRDTLTIDIHDELGIYNILPKNDSNLVTYAIFAPSYHNGQNDATFYNCDSTFKPNNSNNVVYRFPDYSYINKLKFEPCDYKIAFSDTVTLRIVIQFNNTNDTNYELILKVVDPDLEPVASIDEYIVSIEDIKVYPNPVVDYITVDFETDFTDVEVVLYSLSGSVLEVNNDYRFNGKNSVRMDMYDYPKGIYLVKIGSETRKIVKN